MGKKYNSIPAEIKMFISKQKIFFVGTATDASRINVSPKGGDTLRVTGDNEIVWLNLTGSGNETAAHLQKNKRMTIMFCAFEGKPMILRLYGTARIFHEKDLQFQQSKHLFPEIPGSRQIIKMKVDLVQTSCGMAVPLMDFKTEREELNKWAEKQGPQRLSEYRKQKNTVSIDGEPIIDD
jgi:hypothetical protein